MELSEPVARDVIADVHDNPSRRKSGRIRQKPVLLNKDPNLSQVPNGSAKRKRAGRVRDSDEDGDETANAQEDESSPEESDPDEEELKEKRRKAGKKASTKPTTKKPKTGNTMSTKLAVRPAAASDGQKASRTKKSRAQAPNNAADDGTGLYAEVFSRGHTLDGVAADWIARWEENNAQAMGDLVNFVLKCTGCQLQVNIHDIEDVDNVLSKLSDLQDEYQAQKITDYPLISRVKGNAGFRATMTGFFETLIASCHAAGLLYSEPAIIENIDVWLTTMSSSSIRPFRHTSTLISLTIGNAMCKVASDIAETTAKTMRQKDGEQKKKSVNKERVKALEVKIGEEEKKRAQALDILQATFDGVFIHRYRDVDPKVRADCVAALGTWIITLPEAYFESTYLRYFGWVLSDTSAPTRAEVIKQLSKLFKNKENVARLRTFTERFRSRLVEMAVRDSEVSVRASTVELLDMIRQTGLLEPDDIDNIGRLIFDTELRVRKAVAGFFAENINDLFDTTLEDFGGEEGLAEVLGEEVEDDYGAPRFSWLKLKCIAEALQSYNDEGEEDEKATPRQADGGLIATGVDSRYALAAQTIYDGIAEAREWEVIAGYLLYDLSAVGGATDLADAAFKNRCLLTQQEDILLLEILNVAVRSRLTEAIEPEIDKKGKKTKRRKGESREIQESTALHLAEVLPRLLKKFGSGSRTASAVLRLEHVLNLEIFQELRQDSTEYASLLDDINKQFLTHGDQGVLVEASTALLHAKSFEDLEEVTENKVQELWTDTVDSLRSAIGAGVGNNISETCSAVRRIANLARVADCTTAFAPEVQQNKRAKPMHPPKMSALELLTDLIRDPYLDSDAGAEGEEILINTMKTILFFYMWTVRFLMDTLTADSHTAALPEYSSFTSSLTSIMEARASTSPVRIAAAGTLLDLHTLFATFRHTNLAVENLIQHIPPTAQKLTLATYTALEKLFAKSSRRTLEDAPDDDLASDPEGSSDEEDEESSLIQQETLVAEKQLCELAGKMVLSIIGHVLDHEGENKGRIRQRLLRNRARLGSNYKEVVAYLDGPQTKGKKHVRKVATKKKADRSVQPEDEESEGDEQPQHEEGGEEDLRERELVEDRIVDLDDGDGDGNGPEDEAGKDDVEDDVIGD